MQTKSTQIPQKNFYFEMFEEESAAIEIGNECLQKFNWDAALAIQKYPCHATEIVLASMFNKLTRKLESHGDLIRHLHTLISACDHTNYCLN